ncbi:pyrimidine reductase family protein [Pseudarthrobacter sp. RMG13]|uniref:Pyrimidine reductase family protein n=1 Tax=Pseudarthrobacter humi TaxID=2952523 RepID=A0ABT1LTT3_9MICC|nr:pyrimidine reductase family protein [Pseudarthrobacter humi]MCP9001878.1 pyrimidine reductase family protein [Pseudarthrobacter humi]
MIDRLLPGHVAAATDQQLVDWYTHPVASGPRVSFNFVSSLDGAATLNGRSGELGNAADRRIMKLLRRVADIILVGAGTVRAEGYSGDLIDPEDSRWRQDHGKSSRPSLAMVSGSLSVDPGMPFFTAAAERPLIITAEEADPARKRRLEKVADVLVCGQRSLDVEVLIHELGLRGFSRLHSEGGPRLFGTFQQANRVDELCLSVSPVLVGGPGVRIAVSSTQNPQPSHMHLDHVLRSGDMLFLRYLARQDGGPAEHRAAPGVPPPSKGS